MGVPHFNAVAGVICEYPDKYFTSPETGIVLPEAKNRTIVSSFIWTKYRNVTEGGADRQTDRDRF